MAPATSTRPLNGEAKEVDGVALDNHVPIPPMAGSGCTNLPRGPGGVCPPPSTPATSTRPLNGEAKEVGGVTLDDHVPITPMGPSGCTNLPSGPGGVCPPPSTPRHG
ncbi:hypothetical protein PTKIN_Ptkin09bG0049700 [Pterospermum kingtungense]